MELATRIPTTQDSQRVPVRRFWWVKVAFVFAALGLGTAAVLYMSLDSPAFLHAEGGPIETIQLVSWYLAAAISFAACARGPRRDDRLLCGWRGVLALAIAARELDLHERLNSDVIGKFGVHYRLDWWLDGSIPIWLKAGWGMIALAGILLLLLPPLLVRPPTVRLLRVGDTSTWMFLIAFGMLILGYALDDFLGRGTIVESIQITQALEELAELAGVGAFVSSCLALLFVPYSVRKARALAWCATARTRAP